MSTGRHVLPPSFRVVEEIVDRRREFTAREIAEACEMYTATVHETLRRLEATRMVRRTQTGRGGFDRHVTKWVSNLRWRE